MDSLFLACLLLVAPPSIKTDSEVPSVRGLDPADAEFVENLLTDLKSTDKDRRAKAALAFKTLRKSNSKIAVRVEQSSPEAERDSIRAQRILKVAIPHLLNLIAEDRQPKETRIVALELCVIGAPPREFLSRLIFLINENDEDIRYYLISASGLVLESIQEKNDDVQAVCKVLVKCLNNKRETIQNRVAAVGALASVKIENEETMSSVLRIIQDKGESHELRANLIPFLQLLASTANKTDSVVPILFDAFTDSRESVNVRIASSSTILSLAGGITVIDQETMVKLSRISADTHEPDSIRELAISVSEILKLVQQSKSSKCL